MSVLYLGIKQRICLPFAVASSLLFRRDFTMTDVDTSSPSVLLTRTESSKIFLDANDGVELRGPKIRTEDNLNPAFCIVYDTTASASSAAFLSVAVTSTKRFLLADELRS